MAEKWFDDLPDDAMRIDSNGMYRDALEQVKSGLSNGLDFERAAAQVIIPDENLRESVLDEVLKVIIAEEHFSKKIPLDRISSALKLPLERIAKAVSEMFEDVEKSEVDFYHKNTGYGTEH